MSTPILSTVRLSKRYGNIKAVRQLNIDVPQGSIFGLLGPNGSGKSTTLGMILGIIQPDEGEYSWFGEADADQARRRIGALLEQPNFYGYMSAYDNLRLVAKIKGKGIDKIEDTLRWVGLGQRMRSKFKTFSTGMKQRLALASTLLSDPDVVVLDEPTNGMDPKGIIEIRDLIIQLGDSGKTVILASHLLDEVEKVCTHAAILKSGQLLEIRDLHAEDTTKRQYVLSCSDLLALRAIVTASERLHLVRESVDSLEVSTELSGEEINQLCFSKGVILNTIAAKKRTLEEQFLEITEDNA